MRNNRGILGLDKMRGERFMSVFMSGSILKGVEELWWTKKRGESMK